MKVSEGFMLRVLNGEFKGRVFPLRDSLDIGSGGDCGLRLRDEQVSLNHARLQREGDSLVVEDLGSSRGTFLNEKPVERANLKKGDLLKIGRTRLSVVFQNAAPGTVDGDVAGTEVFDSRFLERARATEARKVQLEKARARLTRENEDLREKLDIEKAQRGELERKLKKSGGASRPPGPARQEQVRLQEELKSALETRTRLAVLLKAARVKISRLEMEREDPQEAIESRILSLQEELAAVRQELDDQAERYQEELSEAVTSSEDIDQARSELRDLGEKFLQGEASRADLGEKLAEKEAELAELALDHRELSLRLDTAEEQKSRLESGQVEAGKHREEADALRVEVVDLRQELDLLEAENTQGAQTHREELTVLSTDHQRNLEESQLEIREAFEKRVAELDSLNTKLAADLETRESESRERVARLEQGQASREEFKARCAEAEKQRELLESELESRLETIATQAGALEELDGRLQEVGREFSSRELEQEKKADRLCREVDLLRGRIAAAEKKRQGQEGRLDGLDDREASLSAELLALKGYADDVRRRLLEKGALLDELRARLRIEADPAGIE